jgi:hypothetical protein
MPYSSSLSDTEWEILFPPVASAPAAQEANPTCELDKAENPRWHSLPTQEWL